MKALDEQIASYGAYHRDARNRLTHFIGVPLIVFAVLLALGWLRVPFAGTTVSAAVPCTLVLLGYYFRLDRTLALAMTGFMLVLLFFSEMIALAPWRESLAVFLIAFVGGWTLQLIGHYFEGRKPALVDNLLQVFVAPIFLMAEVFFALGWRPELRERVERTARMRDPGHRSAPLI
jgi:uncharacterized membrane protein YGL010W